MKRQRLYTGPKGFLLQAGESRRDPKQEAFSDFKSPAGNWISLSVFGILVGTLVFALLSGFLLFQHSTQAKADSVLRAEITWSTDADIDLHVWDSEGNQAFWAEPDGIPGGQLSQDIVPSPGDQTVKAEFFSDLDSTKPLGFCAFNYRDRFLAGTQVNYRIRQLDGSFSTGQFTLGNRQWGIVGAVPAGSIPLTQRCSNVGELRVENLGSGSGSVTSSPAGINCGDDCFEEYDLFTEVTLTANPVERSTFVGWIVSPQSVNSNCPGIGPCRISISTASTVKAVFNQSQAPPAPIGALTPIIPPAPGGGSVPINQQTTEEGQTFITIPAGAPQLFPDRCLPLQLNIPINSGAGVVSDVSVLLNNSSYSGAEVNAGIWRVEIDCAEHGSLWLRYTLTEGDISQEFLVPIGGIELIDPQGVVYDTDLFNAAKAQGKSDEEARGAAALSGATVRLQRLSAGTFANVLSGDPGILPNVNPQITGSDGIYQWDVSAGTYRVVVSSAGYPTIESRSVDIPPPVLDLHIPMTKTPNPPGLGKLTVKGSAKVKRGKKTSYKVTFRNTGGATARGLVIKAKGKGAKASKSAGTLTAGKSKTVSLQVKFKKKGKVKVTFTVTSRNAGKKSAAKTVRVR